MCFLLVIYMELFWCILELAWNGNLKILCIFFYYWNGVIADEIRHNSSAIVFLFLFLYSLADELWHVSSAKLTIADERGSIF